MNIADKPRTITNEQFQAILANPPEGLDQLCFQYRQTVGSMNQANANQVRAESQAKLLRDQVIKLDGTADGLKQAILTLYIHNEAQLQLVNDKEV